MTQCIYRTVRACPICGGHDALALHEQRFVLPEGSPLPLAYTVACCESCGAGFADTPATQDVYDQHYEQFSKYDDPAHGTGGGASPLDRERLEETASLLATQPLPRGVSSRVLDIGCAGGGLLVALADRGFREVEGMDPSAACVQRVRKHGFACHQGNLSDLQRAPPTEAYDVVILSHVLEHVVNVSDALRAVHGLLADGGVCYIEVPDASRYSAETFVPFYFFDAEHINHFCRVTLKNLAWANAFDALFDGERSLRVDGGKTYPAAWSLFQKRDGARKLAPVTTLRGALAAYIESSERGSDQRLLEDLASSRCPVLLWGAGSHAQRMLRNSPLARCNLVGIVDRDPGKQGRSLLGYRIGAPEAVLGDLPPEVAIVIASVLHGDQIAASIEEAGLHNRVVVAR